MILAENIHGVDLSPQAVEITQLALWIRSARKGRRLDDLTHNIICHNSLVGDKTVDERAMNWKEEFPNIFVRKNPGFDAVIGNPPWERMKLQEREFFAFSAPEIAMPPMPPTAKRWWKPSDRKFPRCMLPILTR